MGIYQNRGLHARSLQGRTAPAGTNLDTLAAELQGRMSNLDQLIARYTEMIDRGGLTDAAKSELEKQARSVQELAGKLNDIQQEMVAGAQARQHAPDSVGAIIARNGEFVRQAADLLNNRMRGSVTIRLSARNTLTLSAIGADLKLVDSATVVAPGQQPLSVLDLIPWAETTSPLISVLRESASTMLADITAEGAPKPESSLTLGPVDVKIVVIAHWMRVSNQVLADMPMLESYLQGRLAYAVRLKLEALVINGTGDIKGLMATGNHIVADAEPSALDTLNKSKYTAWSSFLPPEAIILHPLDWSAIETMKGTDGHYIFGIPNGSAQPMLWSTPVVLSPAMPQGKHWIGNLSQATQGYIRQDVDVVLSTEDQDNFVKNLVTVRAEGRFGFAVLMPDAGVGGALTGVAGTSVDP